MWQCFKILTIFCFLIICTTASADDLLSKRILKYNNIELPVKKKFVVDSNKLILPIKYFHKKYTSNYTKQIIKYRSSKINYYLFGILFLLLTSAAIVRFSFINNFKVQLKFFSEFRFKEIEEFTNFRVFYFHLIYITIISYIVYIGLHKFFLNYIDSHSIFLISFYLFIYLLIRRLITKLMYYIFEIGKANHNLLYIWNDSCVLVSMIVLPLLIIESVANPKFKTTVILIAVFIILFFYLFKILKIISNNYQLLARNFINVLIYFVAIELLPLILLAKFYSLNNHFLSNG